MSNSIPLYSDKIPYSINGSQQIPTVVIYPAADSSSAVVICPGGGYDHLAHHEGEPVAESFVEQGISAFVLRYRLHPCHHAAPFNDVLRAVRIARSMGYERVAVLGFSAGGHAACCAATLYNEAILNIDDPIDRFRSRPDALISCYSVVSFLDHPHRGSVMRLLQQDQAKDELLSHYSAEMQVGTATPPAFIWHTTGDTAVDPQNSLNLAAAFKHFGIAYELHLFNGGRHGLGLAKEYPAIAQWFPLCITWLRCQAFIE